MSVHMLFAPTGTLKIRTAAYHSVHADLRKTYRKGNSAATAKRQRSLARKRKYKQTGDING